jgi:copper chaperone CopZ
MTVVGSGFAKDKKEGKKKKTAEVTFVVNMVCDNCKAKIERHLAWEKGVKDLKVNLDEKTVKVKYDPSKTDEETLKKFIEGLEYTCEIAEESGDK